MKLIRYGAEGHEKPGLIDDNGTIRDLSDHVHDINGANISDEVLERLRLLDVEKLKKVTDTTRFGPPISGIGKFICIGLNFKDHAEEIAAVSGRPPTIPQHPVIFLKALSSIVGANDNVMIPKESVKTDWEVELGVVIGKKAKYVSKEDSLDYVAGYCIVNDVSERYFQSELSGQWTKGKSCDTFGPIGPWLVTRDEIPDPQNLKMTTDVNGVRKQGGNSTNMIFTIPEIISHLSQIFTLHPGDLISTGTPAGVGAGFKNPEFLKAGDVMELTIEGLGVQRQTLILESDS